MRTAFFEELMGEAERDPRIMLMTGDLGFGVIEPFARRFPDRFINAGVAEQNMTGVATGLALSGRIVFTYSIANFPTLRCLEQIRNDACYHNANVKIVAVGGGLAYGSLGMSHHATEDLAIARALPNLTVLAPGDPIETRALTKAVVRREGPAYLRLGRAGEPTVHHGSIEFEIGKAYQVTDGLDATLITTGGMLPLVAKVTRQLQREGLSVRLLSMHTVKPIDRDAVRRAARDTPLVATIEEHGIIGGLGSAVAEIIAEEPDARARLFRIGLPSAFVTTAGSREYLLHEFGLSEPRLLERLRNLVSNASAVPLKP